LFKLCFITSQTVNHPKVPPQVDVSTGKIVPVKPAVEFQNGRLG
jgi:hypothetical protein